MGAKDWLNRNRGEIAADQLIGIAKDVQEGRLTPEEGRRVAETTTKHLPEEVKAIATEVVNRKTRRSS